VSRNKKIKGDVHVNSSSYIPQIKLHAAVNLAVVGIRAGDVVSKSLSFGIARALLRYEKA